MLSPLQVIYCPKKYKHTSAYNFLIVGKFNKGGQSWTSFKNDMWDWKNCRKTTKNI